MNFIMNIIGYPLGWIMWAAYKVVPVYSIALLIFTLIVKAATLPLSVKQQKNTAQAALFRPKTDAINKKYANNKRKAQEEINKLYEREGFNPFGGCGALAVQLPVIYGLIDVVYRPMTHLLRMSGSVITKAQEILVNAGAVDIGKRAGIDVQLRLLGAVRENRDILVSGIGQANYDKMASLDLNFFGINLGATPTWAWNMLILIPIFSLITSLAASIISMKMTDQNQSQGKGCTYGMMFGMPLMSAYFSFIVPAGVGLYWIISNIIAGVQSVVLRKIYTPEKLQAMIDRDKANGKVKKKSGLMQKMLAAQEQAAAQQGAYSESEEKDAQENSKALKEAQRIKDMSDKERLAEARRRYAEKYGDEYDDKQ